MSSPITKDNELKKEKFEAMAYLERFNDLENMIELRKRIVTLESQISSSSTVKLAIDLQAAKTAYKNIYNKYFIVYEGNT